ncbi:MAG TPA: hypothetical protein VK206_11855, partial [Anaerolineales bacterium]|nr:hypothetical protein [Anaerolineales bacterium]
YVASVIRTVKGENEMYAINKIFRVPLDAAGKPEPGGESGSLVFDSNAPDTPTFEGKKDTLVMASVRRFAAEEFFVRVEYGTPPDLKWVAFPD